MEDAIVREALIESYRAFVQILSDRGLYFHPVSDADLAKASIQDLNDLVRRARDLARTPTT